MSIHIPCEKLHRHVPFQLLLVLSILFLGSTSVLQASIWHVNNQIGQDTNDGQTKDAGPQGVGPFRTIQHALNVATTADTIVIANTGLPYKECLSLGGPDNSGFPGAPFRIVGNGAILSGTILTPPRDWENVDVDVFRFRPENGAFQQLYLSQRPASYVDVDGDDYSNMPARSWTLKNGKIYFKTDPGMLPDAYALSHSLRQTGITLYAVNYVAIENLKVQGFYLDGVSAPDNVKNSQLVGVTSRGNGRCGVRVGGACQLSLNSCLLGDNHHTQLRTESVAKVELAGCSLLENSHGPVVERLGGVISESAGVAQPAIPAQRPADNVAPAAQDNDDPFAG